MRWRHFDLIAGVFLFGIVAGDVRAAVTVPPTPREFRGVWVATVRNIDYPSSRHLSTAQQQSQLLAIMDRAQANHLNAVIFQVRPACDALYQSSIEPWSYWLTGAEGVAPNPPWDPLQFAVQEAHARGLELHAWFNPYRAQNTTGYSHAATHIANVSPELVYNYGSDQWLDPGRVEVQDYSTRVVVDVVNRYDIDAVHIDDYFYPYPTGDPFPDGATYQAYLDGGGALSLGDWRRQNVNTLVERLDQAIHAAKPWVRFGISPYGTWRPNNPPGQAGSFDAYTAIYADSRLWLQQGWCDYFVPQLYWKPSSASPNFNAVLDWWIGQNTLNRHLYSGLFTGSITFGSGWTTGDILTEVQATEARHPGATGHVHFSERQFPITSPSIANVLVAGPYETRALPPASTWLDDTPPASPVIDTATGTGPYTVTWSDGDAEAPWLFVVHWERASQWTHEILPGSQHSFQIPASGDGAPTAIAVSSVDRVNNESVPAMTTAWPVGISLFGP